MNSISNLLLLNKFSISKVDFNNLENLPDFTELSECLCTYNVLLLYVDVPDVTVVEEPEMSS